MATRSTMAFHMKHKHSGKQVQIQPVVFKDEELPYASIPLTDYEVMYSKDSLDKESKSNLEKANLSKSKLIFVHEMGTLLPNGVIQLTPLATWDDIRDHLILMVRMVCGYNNPNDIIDIAFSTLPFFTPEVTKVVDTRNTIPYDVFPDCASVHISMLKRASVGWRPLMVAHFLCDQCGVSKGFLKACKSCKTKFCSESCKQQYTKQKSKKECLECK